MPKAATVLDFYATTQKLKTVLRAGWQIWDVNSGRLESIAEHIYGTQMLALAMYSEYDYSLDLSKVIMMLACHELEEIAIGDITPFDDISTAEKQRRGHAAVAKILAPLASHQQIMDLVLEFDARKTPEAKFAYHCDKLEAILQSYIYDQAGAFDVGKVLSTPGTLNATTRDILAEHRNAAVVFTEYWRHRDGFDDPNFLAVSDAAEDACLQK